jgi:membrane peptidoglycan carboxypeptidase
MADQPDKKPVPPDTGPSPTDKQQAGIPMPGGKPPSDQAAPSPEEITGWHEPPVEEGSSRPVIVEDWFTPEGATAEPLSTPPETVSEEPQPSAAHPEELPGATPAQSGAWYTPLDAQLDALLSGAADTIAEVHEPKSASPRAGSHPPGPPAAAQPAAEIGPQAAAETQAQPAGQTRPQPAVSEGWSAPQGAAAEGGLPAQESTPGEDQGETQVLRSEVEAAGQEAAAETMVEEPPPAAGSTPPPESTSPQPVSPGLTPAEAAMLAEQRGAAEQRPPVGSQATALSEAGAASQPVPTPAAQPEPSPFEQVESKVKVLRERYQAGYLTREQLQNELRSLMILGEDGRWWMLGLESDRWYYYDGRNWVPDTPPGYEERVKGSAVPTETGMQEVVVDSSAGPGMDQGQTELTAPAVDEEGQLLPRRVPQEDPSATLVSPSTPFMEPMRPSEAPTQQKARQVETEAETGGSAFSPAPGQGIPARPGQPAQPGVPEPTMRSAAVSGGPTIVRGAQAAQGTPGPAGAGVSAPKPRIGEFPQPDYSEAMGASRNRNTYVKWAIRFSVFSIIGGMALTLILLLGTIFFYFYEVNRYSGAVASLQNRAANFETTLIMDANGNTLAEFNNPNTGVRKSVPLDEISPWLIDATISTENETFYTDPGFSVAAIVRAMYQNLRAGNTVSGASTITQQLAKALVLDTELASQRTVERKIIEAIVASEIKRKYSKNQILEIYLNEIFYGNLAYGAEAAAQTYFHKPASDLNPAEAAFLAGLPQSPATYDPVVNREAAISRMHTVLRLMSEANGSGCIRIEHTDATKWGVPNGGALCITAKKQPDGSVLYYYQDPNIAEPQELTLEIALVETATFSLPEFKAEHPHFVNYVWQQLENTYGSQAIYSAGYRVYTTLDETIQGAAEQAVTNRLAELQAKGVDASNASVVVMRPSDGAVLAMVGSADYYNTKIDGQVNVAFTGQQPGSSIKPILYLAALQPNDQGQYWTPATVIWDVYSNFNGYVPTDYDNAYHGPETVRDALGNSLNVPAVKTMAFVGLDRFTKMAEEVGLTFPLGDPIERNAGLTTALGSVEVRLFDMVSAYSVLANYGVRMNPYSILYIQDSKGNEIYRAEASPTGLQVIPPEFAYLITNILADPQARLMEFGTGWPMVLSNGREAAVKTGTSNDSRDIWTIGYTPQIAVGVWVGNSDNRPMYGASGYAGAAPIWNDVMEAALAGQPVVPFQQPPAIIQKVVCDDSGAEPSPGCDGRTHTEIFAASAPPPGPDQDIFRTLQVDGYTGKLANQYCQDDVVTRTFLAIDDSTAFNWINNTPEGNSWATQRGLEPPLAPPPTEYCAPNEQRPVVVVSFPTQDMTVEGVVPVRGTINMPDFSRYELRYGIGPSPDTFSDPLVVDQNQHPEADSLLAQFDTRGLQNGQYTLRIVAIDIYGRSVTRDIPINVNNPAPTPAPLPNPTFAPTLTPQGFGPAATPPPGGVFPSPTLAPTLTPTWTLTPTPG